MVKIAQTFLHRLGKLHATKLNVTLSNRDVRKLTF
jgi:hypothetical protein